MASDAGQRAFRNRNQARPAPGAVIYLRVSTTRQLQGEVSIPSQRRAALAHCGQIGRAVVAEFMDAVSGTDDARPEFQRMLELTRQPACAFDTIVIYSLSRFYRSGPEAELLIRDLAKWGIRV